MVRVKAFDAVDAWPERAYRRLGRRVFVAFVFAMWGIALIYSVLMIVCFARLQRIPTGEAAPAFGLYMLIAVGGLLLALLPAVRMLDRACEGEPDEVWSALLGLPFKVTRWITLVELVWVAPAGLLVVGPTFRFDRNLFLVLVLALVPVGVGMIAVAMAFGGQLVLRPLVREVARSLAVFPDCESGMPVRVKVLVSVPAVSLAMTEVGVLVGAAPGTDSATLLRRLLASALVTLVAFVPVALLLAYCLPQPLGDLVDATTRLRNGDFSTRVPEVSADEYGTLARSFNSALAGLACGQQLAGDNELLLDEIRSSRVRIVTAADAERRRVERNLHDGAQQRLVALALDLRLLEERTSGASRPELATMARDAGENLRGALDELRELARGLHPPVLATDGLRPALEQLACRATVPVEITAPDDRFDSAIESTAYFVASEAMANIAKYSHATRASVTVHRSNGSLVIEIADDGIGGARAEAGSGLGGLGDRVVALDGVLSVHSPPGGGTRVRAELPIEEP